MKLWMIGVIGMSIALGTVGCAPRGDVIVGSLHIDSPWARATPPGAKVAGGFLVVRNVGAKDDRLVFAYSDAADKVEIHAVREQDGLLRMRHLSDGLPVPAGAAVTLAPGSDHLMFIAPRRPFAEGEMVTATLRFERAGEVVVPFPVRDAGARDSSATHH